MLPEVSATRTIEDMSGFTGRTVSGVTSYSVFSYAAYTGAGVGVGTGVGTGAGVGAGAGVRVGTGVPVLPMKGTEGAGPQAMPAAAISDTSVEAVFEDLAMRAKEESLV